jgi:hypothetical protein
MVPAMAPRHSPTVNGSGPAAFHALAPKKRGRPLGDKAKAIREAVVDLADEFDVMTVRGIFYKLVSRGIVPKTEAGGYRPVQVQVLKMRREGLLEWSFVADGTRWMRKPASYDDVDDYLKRITRFYRRDLWQGQGARAEVWLEKDALADIIISATEAWDVPLMVSRGTSSATFLNSASRTAVEAWEHRGQATRIFAMYDFDAAGERTARAVRRAVVEDTDAPVEFTRLAVTAEQVAEWNLPTRPAKGTDPEAGSWGDDAVELDAIEPDRLSGLVLDAILPRGPARLGSAVLGRG